MRIMDCVLLLFQRKIDSVTPDQERPGVKPSWTEALKLMNNSGFLSMLLSFQKVRRCQQHYYSYNNLQRSCESVLILYVLYLQELKFRGSLKHIKYYVPTVADNCVTVFLFIFMVPYLHNLSSGSHSFFQWQKQISQTLHLILSSIVSLFRQFSCSSVGIFLKRTHCWFFSCLTTFTATRPVCMPSSELLELGSQEEI